MANYNLTQTGDEVQAYIDSIPVIDVTGTLNGSAITFGSNPYTQIAANYAADCSSIVRLTVGTAVYLLRVTQYDGTNYTAAEMSGAHNVVATIGSSSASATIDAGIDATPTQGSDNLVKSGGVAGELDAIINGGYIAKKYTTFPNSGRYLTNGTLSATGWYHTDLIPINGGSTINTYLRCYVSTNTPIVIYYNASQAQIGYELPATGGREVRTYTAPSNAAYVRAQVSKVPNGDYIIIPNPINGIFTDEEDIAALKNIVAPIPSMRELQIINRYLFTIQGFARPVGTISTASGYHRTDYLDVSHIDKLKIYIKETAASAAPIVWYDANKGFLSSVVAPDQTSFHWYEVDKPTGARYVIFSTTDGPSMLSPLTGSVFSTLQKNNVYISPTGDDSNNGDENAPLKTAFGAKTMGANEVVFLTGDYYDYLLDLADFPKMTFRYGSRLIYGTRITSATLESGYTRVYKAAYSGTIATNGFVWQHDVPDADTLIPAVDYMPQYHTGRTHRLPSTRLYKVNSIAEVESASHYAYYLSSGTLYFSCPSAVSETNPIVVPDATASRLTNNSPIELNIIGMKVLYRELYLNAASGRLDRVCAMFANTDTIAYKDCQFIEFNQCEAAGSQNDGFNGRDFNMAIFKDCYAHDNADDGQSGHIDCTDTFFGGLYEYNGSGVTPAGGANAACYNVICRYNGDHDWLSDNYGSAFSAQGSSGKISGILCVGCYAVGNKIGFRSTDATGSMYINCVAKDNTTNFGTNGEKINCVTL